MMHGTLGGSPHSRQYAGQGLHGPRRHRFSSHVARVHTNKRPHLPQPEDSDQQRRPRKSSGGSGGSSDGLQLNPPKLRPLTKQLPNDAILDWRSYRAKLVLMERRGLLAPGCSSPTAFTFSSTSWAHELPAPEVGCVLVARQEGMDFFDRTVVLLVAHDPVHGSVGFVLNKPSPLRMCEVQLSATAKGVLDTFGSQRLQLGGPVHMETLTLLHAFSGLAGAQKVSEGVYYGGLPAAVELVRSGLAQPDDFTLLLGMTGWAPNQLDHEIACGSWHVVAAGQGLVLPPKSKAYGRAPAALWRQLLGLIGAQAQTDRTH